MKKAYWIILSIIIIVVLCMSLVPRASKTYVFSNPSQDVVSIELMINTNETGQAEEDKLLSQKLLSKDEIEGFMSEIHKLETRRCYPPMWGWGD